MKPMLVHTVRILVLMLLFASIINGEDPSRPYPDRWRGLVLDESTIEDAKQTLGSPDKEKESKFYAFALRGKFEKGMKLLYLEWKKIPGFDSVKLGFGADHKLKEIQLDLKEKLPPAAIGNNYSLAFEPVFDGLDVGWFPGRYEQNQGKIYTTQFPQFYYLAGISERSIVFAMVTQGSLGFVGKTMAGVHDTQGFPGKVERLQLLGRSLETKQGHDLLK